MFGINSSLGKPKLSTTLVPKSKALQRVLAGVNSLRSGRTKSRGLAAASSDKANIKGKPPTPNAFQVGNQKSGPAFRGIRQRNAQVTEGQELRQLQRSIVNIEFEISKERKQPNPNRGLIHDLGTLKIEENDKMFALMKSIQARESRGISKTPKAEVGATVRSLSDFNDVAGKNKVLPADLKASAELKKVSELKEAAELELAGSTDAEQSLRLVEFLADVNAEVLKLTERAFGSRS